MKKSLALALGLSAVLLTAPAPAVAAAAAGAARGTPASAPSPAARPLDINRASATELARLPGGSAAEAARIVAGRPYGSKGQLVSRQAVDAARYAEIKSAVFAGQPRKTTSKPAPPSPSPR